MQSADRLPTDRASRGPSATAELMRRSTAWRSEADPGASSTWVLVAPGSASVRQAYSTSAVLHSVLLSAVVPTQRIRGFTTMRYINLRFTYLLTYTRPRLLDALAPHRLSHLDFRVINIVSRVNLMKLFTELTLSLFCVYHA